MPKATLKDVAAMAGVSIKTVSRVVNKEPNVRAATRDSVLRAVDTLGYRPDASARRLAGSRSYLIGLIYEDPSPYDNPSGNYVIDLQSGVLAAVKAQGYDLLIHPCGMQAGGIAEEIVGVVEQARLDGVILAPPIAEQSNVASALRRRDTPFVRISPGRRTRSSESVHTNDRDACADMTRYLASLGHGSIEALHRMIEAKKLSFEDRGRQIADPRLLEEIEAALGENNVHAGTFRLELTESVLMDNAETVHRILSALRRQGVRIWVDDFGTGYSSLSHLQQFPPDALKIDRAFVQGLPDDQEQSAIVRAVIYLARALGIDVVAEGVETAENLRALQAVGCDHAQGYYFGKAEASSTAGELLDADSDFRDRGDLHRLA